MRTFLLLGLFVLLLALSAVLIASGWSVGFLDNLEPLRGS